MGDKRRGCRNAKVEQADAEYELRKAEARINSHPHVVTLESIERKFKLKPNQLKNYRANHYYGRYR
jgi:hypothetical protein